MKSILAPVRSPTSRATATVVAKPLLTFLQSVLAGTAPGVPTTPAPRTFR